MTEPRIEGSLGDLSFRGPTRAAPRRDSAPGYFWQGVAIFLAVALAHPFYTYYVHSRLLASELSDAITEASAQVDGLVRQAQKDSREAAVASAARSLAQRQQGVVVAGTTMVGSNRMVIVKLGQASLGEARASICRQAAASFKQPLAGERLRVQRHRGAQPAVDVGSITCD